MSPEGLVLKGKVGSLIYLPTHPTCEAAGVEGVGVARMSRRRWMGPHPWLASRARSLSGVCC